MIGSEYKTLLFTIFITNVVSILFLALVIDDIFPNRTALIIVGALALFLVDLFMGLTITIDPGIMPKSISYIEQPSDLARIPVNKRAKGHCDITNKTHLMRIKYCKTCNIFRPPRTSHCGICDVCIEQFDHHCPWLGSCIGKRNYKYFYIYVVMLAFLVLYSFVISILQMVDRTDRISANENVSGGSAFGKALAANPMAIITCIVTFFGGWFVCGLLGYHTFLISSNQTTHEQLKKAWDKAAGNPYSRNNFFKSMFKLYKWHLRPSFIPNRQKVTVDFGKDVSSYPRPNSHFNSGVNEGLIDQPRINQAVKIYPGEIYDPDIYDDDNKTEVDDDTNLNRIEHDRLVTQKDHSKFGDSKYGDHSQLKNNYGNSTFNDDKPSVIQNKSASHIHKKTPLAVVHSSDFENRNNGDLERGTVSDRKGKPTNLILSDLNDPKQDLKAKFQAYKSADFE